MALGRLRGRPATAFNWLCSSIEREGLAAAPSHLAESHPGTYHFIMRILVACSEGIGRYLPFVPFLDQARRNDGQTLVVASSSLQDAVEKTGHPFKSSSPRKQHGAQSSQLAVMEQVIRDWRPDLILREPWEYASAEAAGWLGVPTAQVATTLAGFVWDTVGKVAPNLEAMRGGLADELRRSPFLTRLPASLDISPFPVTLRYREPASTPNGALPAWWGDSDAPLVYVTFGTWTGEEWFPEQAYPAAIDAVTGLDARVVMTVGRDFDVSQLPDLPGNVHVEPWIDKADILGQADLVVCHGGAGTVYGTLAVGVPLVIVPIVGDQPANAAAVTGAGAGIEVVTRQDPRRPWRVVSREDSAQIRQAIETVLADGSYRQAAAAVAAEMAAAPMIETLLGQLPGAGYSGSQGAAMTSPTAIPDDTDTGRGQALYLDLMKRVLTNVIYRDPPVNWNGQGDYDIARRRDGSDIPSVAHTMVGLARLDNVQYCLERVLADDVPGDFIETGVWRGGTCIFARAILRAYGVTDRQVWVADSFAGMPRTQTDSHPLDRRLQLHRENDVIAVSAETVAANFERYDLLDEQVRFLKGWFRDSLPDAPISRLSVLRLDGDLYESTMDALNSLYPRLSPGGFTIVDDYHIRACREAVHEYRDQHGITEPLEQIDDYSVYWRRAGLALPVRRGLGIYPVWVAGAHVLLTGSSFRVRT